MKTAVQTTFIDVDLHSSINTGGLTADVKPTTPQSIAWLSVEAGIPAEGACHPNSVITHGSVNRPALPDVLTLERN